MEVAVQASGRDRGGNDEFTETLLSWSLEDISNKGLYLGQVKRIPKTFVSEKDYQESFIYPLLEETRAELLSSLKMIKSLPFAKVTGLQFSKCDKKGMILFDVAVDEWANRFNDRRKEPYRTLPFDVLLLVDAESHPTILEKKTRTLALAVVTNIPGDGYEDAPSKFFEVKTLNDIEVEDNVQLHAVFLISITPSRRIWKALHMTKNWDIIRKVLAIDSTNEGECSLCSGQDTSLRYHDCSDLNDSQMKAISACLQKIRCKHRSTVELIWGPPGTGKTKTTSIMLCKLLKMKCRSLVCTPTNVAIMEVASRVVLEVLRDPSSADIGGKLPIHPLGDILLFGSRERLKIDRNVEEIYLDYRVDRIAECTAPVTGWWYCITSVVDFLDDCNKRYGILLENERTKRSGIDTGGNPSFLETSGCCSNEKSFLQFVRQRFIATMKPLERCLSTLCTHISRSFIGERVFLEIIQLLADLNLFGDLLQGESLLSLRMKVSCSETKGAPNTLRVPLSTLYLKQHEIHGKLLSVRDSLSKLKFPSFKSKDSITEFCYQRASLVFCTASNTYKLHSVNMEPLNLLVIDEAAQLRECESMIPLQLLGLKHAILVGDEKQLPALVLSDDAKRAGFGRSLFRRLSSLGASKHLLNVQYRMHPSISLFPNRKFYGGKIRDAQNVVDQSYKKNYLPWPIFGPYSFINIAHGREGRGGGQTSSRNSVEVAVVLEILNKLCKAWASSPKEKLSVGVISPYSAQVAAIRQKLGVKYENLGEFTVKVMTVDGFQGGEEDIIIISTVRSNDEGFIGFLSNPERTNVALTRARYGLWIVGSEQTLKKKQSEWRALLNDATARQCFFNADDDKDLARAIYEVKLEDDQIEDLLYSGSLLFKDAPWKVTFTKSFNDSFKELPRETKSSVVDILKQLSHGWRPPKQKIEITCRRSSQIVCKCKVSMRPLEDGQKEKKLHLMWTIDIEGAAMFFQVMKLWYIVPGRLIAEKVKEVDDNYEKYGAAYINRCKEKFCEGDLEFPKSWEHPPDFDDTKNATEKHCDEDSNETRAKDLYKWKEDERAETNFESIGVFESDAECFYKQQQFERAGKIYLEKCGKSALPKAAKCFHLAGHYRTATEIYARANMFSECLSACAEGELFELGLDYMHNWKRHKTEDNSTKESSTNIKEVEQDFLELGARYYHGHGDSKTMMRFVRAFHFLDRMRNLLRNLQCLDELISLDEEMGNFYEAANVAKLKGDLLLEAYMFGKGGYFKDASMAILRYILFCSLWESGSNGWPLKQFKGKEELVMKARSYAAVVSEPFFENVRIEATLLLDKNSSLLEMQELLNVSRKTGSLTGEILCARKILETYLSMDSSKFYCNDYMDFGMAKHKETWTSENQVSVENLMQVWNHWREKILHVIQYLQYIGMIHVNEYTCYADFCLNYLGAFKHHANEEEILLLNPLPEWVSIIEDKYLRRRGTMVSVEVRHFISAAQRYWCSELISVGMRLLPNLDTFYKLLVKDAKSEFFQSRALIHIYEVAKFLVESDFFNHSNHDKMILLKFTEEAGLNYCRLMFPSDWRKSTREYMISLRETEVSGCLLKETFGLINTKRSLSYGEMGRYAMVVLGSSKLQNSGSSMDNSKCSEKNQPWKELIDCLHQNVPEKLNELSTEVALIQKLHGALSDTFSANWRNESDYVSPNCFLYLIERLLILSSIFNNHFFATKSGFAEWCIYHSGEYTKPKFSSRADFQQSLDLALGFVSYVVRQLLENEEDTREWIAKSNMNSKEYYPLLVLKLVLMTCLLHMNYGKCSNLLFDLLNKKRISKQLPPEFYDTLWKTRKKQKKLNINAVVLAKAFAKVDDPLVIVSLEKVGSNLMCKDAIFVDMSCTRIIKGSGAAGPSKSSCVIESSSISRNTATRQIRAPSQVYASTSTKEDSNGDVKNELVMKLWSILDLLKGCCNVEDGEKVLHSASSIKVDLDRCLVSFHCSVNQYIWDGKEKLLAGDDVLVMHFAGIVDDLKQISTELDVSVGELKVEDRIPAIKEILGRLQSRRPVVEPLLHQMFLSGSFEIPIYAKDNPRSNEPNESKDSKGSNLGLDFQLPCNGKDNNPGNSETQGKKKQRKKKKKVNGESKAHDPDGSNLALGSFELSCNGKDNNPGNSETQGKKKQRKKKKKVNGESKANDPDGSNLALGSFELSCNGKDNNPGNSETQGKKEQRKKKKKVNGESKAHDPDGSNLALGSF